MVAKCFAVLLILMCSWANAQKILTWKDLADVRYKTIENSNRLFDLQQAVFGDKIKQWGGKQVTITGYFLDLAEGNKAKILSKNPLASCFF